MPPLLTLERIYFGFPICPPVKQIHTASRRLRQPNADIERPGVTSFCFGELEHQLLATIEKDVISVIFHRPVTLDRVWSLRMNPIRDGLVEVQLRRKFVSSLGLRIGTNLEVDMNSSPAIPPGIDRDEPGHSTAVGRLIAAQELLASRVERPISHVRIDRCE